MRKLESGLSLVGGAALGAALMYLLDPDAGRRRREELTDSASNALSGTGEALSSTWETVAERARNVGGALAGHAQHLSDNASHLAGHASKLIDRAGNVTSDSADTVSGWGQGLARQARHLTSALGNRTRSLRSSAANAIDSEDRGPSVTGYTATALGACGLGLGLMYLLDPQKGRGRRAAIVSTLSNVVGETGDAFRCTGRYLSQQFHNVVGQGSSQESGQGRTNEWSERPSGMAGTDAYAPPTDAYSSSRAGSLDPSASSPTSGNVPLL